LWRIWLTPMEVDQTPMELEEAKMMDHQDGVEDAIAMELLEGQELREHSYMDAMMQELGVEQFNGLWRLTRVEEDEAHEDLDRIIEGMRKKQVEVAGVNIVWKALEDLCSTTAYYNMGSWVVDRWRQGNGVEDDRNAGVGDDQDQDAPEVSDLECDPGKLVKGLKYVVKDKPKGRNVPPLGNIPPWEKWKKYYN
jgi:hypothetical protein